MSCRSRSQIRYPSSAPYRVRSLRARLTLSAKCLVQIVQQRMSAIAFWTPEAVGRVAAAACPASFLLGPIKAEEN